MHATSLEHHIILVDRGHLRIYRVERNPGQRTPGLTDVFSMDYMSGRERPQDGDPGRAGWFAGRGGRRGGMSSDQRLPVQRERDRRLVGQVAAQINGYLAQHADSSWDFSAAPGCGWAVLDQLDPAVRERLANLMMKNLVGEPRESLLAHFVP